MSTLQTTVTETDPRAVRSVTLAGLIINLFLGALKGAAGFLFGSQALIADALHSLSDCVTDLAVLIGVHFWSAPPDECHPHGHRRIEALVTLFIGVMLGIAAIGIARQAIVSIGAGQAATLGWGAFAAAVVSVVVKEWLYRWTAAVGRRERSQALIANAWHHRSDALSSLPVAAAVLIQRIWPQFGFIDATAAVIVAVLLLKAAWNIARPALAELTDAGADRQASNEMEQIASAVEGVDSIHALRSRRAGSGYFVDLHVLVDPCMSVFDGHEIARAVRAALIQQGPDVIDVLVHIEPYLPADAPASLTPVV
jgi:cation diffusion facilitator family transporter